MRHTVCKVTELTPGSMKSFLTGKTPIVIVRSRNGPLRALIARCPHQGGDLALGCLTGTTLPSEPGEYRYGREDEIIRCPWHGFEYDVISGRCLGDPERLRVRTLDVWTDGEDVVIDL